MIQEINEIILVAFGRKGVTSVGDVISSISRSHEFIHENCGATHYGSQRLHAFGINFANTREAVNDTMALRDFQWRSLYTFTMRLVQQTEVAVPQRGVF